MISHLLSLIGIGVINDKVINIENRTMVKINNRLTYRSQHRDKVDSKGQYREHKESSYIK